MSDFLLQLKSFLVSLNLPYLFGTFVLFLIIERLYFAHNNQSLRGAFFNVRYTVFYFVVGALIQPVIGFVTSLFVIVAGGGWVRLPDPFESPDLNAAFQGLAYLFIFDLFYYWFHRLQHTFPPLWAQHKFHHSDVEVNVTTTYRHHWFEEPLRMVFILIPMGIVFQVQPVTGGVIGLIFGLWGFFIHSNLRLDLGLFTPLIAGPHAHRIHHSSLVEHAGKNYAALFPMFDVFFKTFVRPKPWEFPSTGLHSGENVSTFAQANLWPFREWMNPSSPSRFVNVAFLSFMTLTFVGSGVLYFSRTSDWVVSLQLPKYVLGERLEFKQGAVAVEYLGKGWSDPEASHTWMDGNEAEVNIRLSHIPPRMLATFLVRAFIDEEKLPRQRYRILLNGDELAESEITSQEPAEISVTIDAYDVNRILRLTFKAPDAASPRNLGIGADGRQLGLALINFRLTAAGS